jgi:hypothetical protein
MYPVCYKNNYINNPIEDQRLLSELIRTYHPFHIAFWNALAITWNQNLNFFHSFLLVKINSIDTFLHGIFCLANPEAEKWGKFQNITPTHQRRKASVDLVKLQLHRLNSSLRNVYDMELNFFVMFPWQHVACPLFSRFFAQVLYLLFAISFLLY